MHRGAKGGDAMRHSIMEVFAKKRPPEGGLACVYCDCLILPLSNKERNGTHNNRTF
jgi:hypothetical protein